MKNILVIGAGRSSKHLIDYLCKHASSSAWNVTVADYDLEMATDKIKGFESASAIKLDITNNDDLNKYIGVTDVVVSLVPAFMHKYIIETSIKHKKHVVSASYVTDEISDFEDKAKEAGVLILKECGLDPGLDHMSAMKVIDDIKNQGHELTDFETFTGGLLAPSKKENPWNYKFTWNPRNVVLAGQGVSLFLQEGRYKYIPYNKLFRRTEIIHIEGYGYFEGYANRDSLKYLDIYKLNNIKTLFRGTLRQPGYCRAWDVFVQLGMTDDSFIIKDTSNMSHRQFLNSFLAYNPHDSVELKLAHYLNLDLDSEIMYKLKWFGFFDDEKIGINEGSPAKLLEHILNKKWELETDDRDMVVMYHKFKYIEQGKIKEKHSHLVLEGNDNSDTAMSKTVGLPLAICTKLILDGKIKATGVHRPISPIFYNPILEELEAEGIVFKEKQIS